MVRTTHVLRSARSANPCAQVWGKPDFEQLMKYMKQAYDDKVYYQDHTWTRDLINPEKVKGEIKRFFKGWTQDDQGVTSENALVF
jgi:hypothetical protein